MNPVIERFVERYVQMQDFYAKAAERCREQCRDILGQNGIRHIATSRAKRPDRLREKLYQRLPDKSYKDDQDIWKDIIDFSGVRVALYFPGDRADAVKLLQEQFTCEEPRKFPKNSLRLGGDIYTYRFRGYSATHLLAKLKPENLKSDESRLAAPRIEIQVASVLMHAWSEVEHDIVYKPLSGKLSENEYALLDQVNGLAFAGELALEQLQRTMRSRIATENKPFDNHYELAAYLHSTIGRDDARMGRADQFLEFLRKLKLDRPHALQEFVVPLKQSAAQNRPVVDQVLERITHKDASRSPELERLWQTISNSGSAISPYGGEPGQCGQAELRLRKRVRTFEEAVRRVVSGLDPSVPSSRLDRELLTKLLGFDGESATNVMEARKVNVLLFDAQWHGTETDIERHSANLARALDLLSKKFPHYLKDQKST